MRRSLIVCVAIAGCARPHATQSSSSTQPRGRPAEVTPLPIEAVVARPIALRDFEHSDVVDPASLPPLRGEMPPKPVVLVPSRPIVIGEALELADLALARGDAFDAAAQYRAFVDSREIDVARYAQFHLARAHAMEGEREEALRSLRLLARGADSIAWLALVELVRLRADEVGEQAALAEVRMLARERFEPLADYLIHTSAAHVASILLVDKSARTKRCAYAYRAIELSPDTSLAGCPTDCRNIIESRAHDSTTRKRNDYVRQLERKIDEVIDRWDALAEATREGRGDAEAWLTLAEDADAIEVPPGPSYTASITTATTRAALTVAIELSLTRMPHEPALTERLLTATRRVQGVAGDRMRARIAAALGAREP